MASYLRLEAAQAAAAPPVTLKPDSPGASKRPISNTSSQDGGLSTLLNAAVDPGQRTALEEFASKYAIIRKLGIGVDGTVYAVKRKTLTNNFQITPDLSTSTHFTTNDSSTTLAAKIAHGYEPTATASLPTLHALLPTSPHILPILDSHASGLWSITPHLHGPTLKAARPVFQNHLPPALFWHIYLSLLAALRALHFAGLAHCDGHVGNVMLDLSRPDYGNLPRVVLIDYSRMCFEGMVRGVDLQGNEIKVREREARCSQAVDLFWFGEDMHQLAHGIEGRSRRDDMTGKCMCKPNVPRDGDEPFKWAKHRVGGSKAHKAFMHSLRLTGSGRNGAKVADFGNVREDAEEFREKLYQPLSEGFLRQLGEAAEEDAKVDERVEEVLEMIRKMKIGEVEDERGGVKN